MPFLVNIETYAAFLLYEVEASQAKIMVDVIFFYAGGINYDNACASLIWQPCGPAARISNDWSWSAKPVR